MSLAERQSKLLHGASHFLRGSCRNKQLLLGVQSCHSVKSLQSVPPLCQQFILNQIPGIVRKTIRPE